MPSRRDTSLQPPDGVLLVALSASAGALALASPVAVGLATAVVLVAAARASPRAARQAFAVLAAAAFALSAVRGARTVAAYRASRAALGPPHGASSSAPSPWPARCVLDAEVTRSPALLGGGLRVVVAVRAGACEPDRGGGAGSVGGAVVALVLPAGDVWPSLARGDRARVVAQLAPTHVLRNPGATEGAEASWALASRRAITLSGAALDIVVLARGRGPAAWIDRARERVRTRIRGTFSPSTEGMARALVLGEDDVADEDRRAFQASGLSHLLAVSGMHLVIVVASAVAGVRALLARCPSVASRVEPGRLACALGIPLAFAYADLAGGSGSADRAAFMAAAALSARVLARRSDPWRALALSVLAMTARDPLAPFDLSFLLSVTATLGLLVIARPLDAELAERVPWLPGAVRAPAAATTGASIACAPLLALMAPELPVASIVANVVAVPVGEAMALPLCLAHAVLGPIPVAERGCALAAEGALGLVRAIARAFAALPLGGLPCPAPTAIELATVGVAAGLISVAALRVRTGLLLLGAGLVIAEAFATRAGSPRGVLRVTFLDVAQGDAALVDLPDGRAMLVDAGGLVGSPVDVGERVLAPVLRARRRARLEAFVLSHPHPDHALGAIRGLARVDVARAWDTGQGEAEHAGAFYTGALATARARGARLERPGELCGHHAFGGAEVDVIAPCPGPDASRGPNDNSFVIRISYGARSFLFVGDAEHAEEEGLLRAGANVRADVLKVGHHGSRTSSSPGFVAAVAPRLAVISSGVRNRFGHPHRPTLLTFARAGVRVLRTDAVGAVTVTTDGASLEVSTAEDPP